MSEIILTINNVDPVDLYGEKNAKLNILKEAYPEVKITSRGSNIKIVGEKKNTQHVKSKLETMVRFIQQNQNLPTDTVREIVKGSNPFMNNGGGSNGSGQTILHGRNGKPIKARTKNQRKMVESVDKNDVLFAIGPAGTGKTYTAVALAVRALKNRLVKKIILTRPAVEAGESLGFLPGDLKEKIDPYLRPLYDALEDMFPAEKLEFFMSNRTIEVAPLAFMRGRTLDHAFIILDEAQNTTSSQLKMFLTRLGPSAKCIITGDLSQIDLPIRQRSGLHFALDILQNLEGIGTVFLDADDVVRHRLVKEIIRAYDKAGQAQQRERQANQVKQSNQEE